MDNKKDQNVESQSSLEDILAIYAHEMRTPISVMKWYFDLIKSEPTCLNLVFPKIEQNLADLTNLIEQQILEIKFKLNKLENECDVNVDLLFKELIIELQENYSNVEFHIKKVNIPNNYIIRVNKNYLKICIANYISNAINFTEKIDKSIRVKIQYGIDNKESNKFIIQVVDKWVGFIDNFEKLFVKHYSYWFSDYKSKKWLNVWLYFVKQICKVYWWEYFAFSEWSNYWSTFWLKIPIKSTSTTLV